MSFIAAAIGTIGSSVIGAVGANNASNQQQAGARAAGQQNQQYFNQLVGYQQPYINQGQTSLNQLGGYLNASATGGAGGQPGLLHNFTAADLTANLAPNYQFQLGQGLGAATNSAAAGGGVNSGNTLAGLQSYAQNYAGNAYQQAFNNYQTQQGNTYSRLLGLAGLGQQAGSNGTLGASTFAGNQGNYSIQGGNAAAYGSIGLANALGGGANSLGGYATLNSLLPSGANPLGSVLDSTSI